MDNVHDSGGHTNGAFDKETYIAQPFDNKNDVHKHNGKEKSLELGEIGIDHPQPKINEDLPIIDQNRFTKWRTRNSVILKRAMVTLLNALVFAYFAYATYHFTELGTRFTYQEWPPTSTNGSNDDNGECKNPCDLKAPDSVGRCPGYCGIEWCNGYGLLLILFVIAYTMLFYYHVLKRFWGEHLYRTMILPCLNRISKFMKPKWMKRSLTIVILAAMLAFVVVDSLDTPERLQSLCGIFVLMGIGYVFSAHRTKINYRPVVLGFTFQFLLGVICMRWEVGRNIFRCLGDKVATFLRYADEGSKFVYGDYLVHSSVFAFTVLPIVFFFSFMISILYYLGVMQFIVEKLGWILQSILGTTVCESVTCAANIFLGMSESPLLIRPYIKHLTASELHVIMASGFATVSGSVLAAFISYGAEASHLITSSVMAAPAALGFAKLFYPETEESKTKSGNMVLEKSTDASILDAASNGASLAIAIVLGITSNLIAFVSFIAFLNGAVNFFGHLVGLDITFEEVFAKIFIPLAWILGIPWTDCENVARLIATKTLVNEFVAYERLGVMKRNHLISLRSSAIATYAICGFANPSSLGIMIATMSTLAPEKRNTVISVAIRGFFSGSIICFLTASIAGLLTTEYMSNEIGNRDYDFKLSL